MRVKVEIEVDFSWKWNEKRDGRLNHLKCVILLYHYACKVVAGKDLH